MKTPLPLYDTFAKQYPFYYQEHIDKTGLYFGNTQTDGLVILNTFTRNKVRPSYDLLALGLKGGGKSVTLKTMVQDQLLLDNKVMALDPEGEYSEMAKAFAGQVIKMNKQSTINPLQIMNTVVADRENITDTLTEENEKQNYINSKLEAIDTNFTSEISRICTFLSQFAPNLDHETIEVFREILLETYSEKGIDKTTDTSTYSATDFPVISDVVNCIAKHMRYTIILRLNLQIYTQH